MRPAWLSLLFVVSFALAGEDGLPDVEAELLEYARKHSSRREWPKAERAYLKVLQSFAESKQAPRVHYELGRLHFRYARRWATAAKWYDQTIAKYPETEWGWKARWGRAETYARMQQIDQAVTLFRMLSNKAPDEKMRSQAAARILSVQNKYFALSVRQSFTVGQAPWVQVQSRGIGNAHMRLESVPYEDVLERIGPQNQNLTAAARASKRRALVKEWNIAFPWMKGRWRNQKAALPALDAGVYLVTARTEGLSFHVVVLVNSFGIVTKAAPDELLVFAQSRRDGTPLAGTDVRVVTSEGTEQMRTASDGLVAMSAVTQGALVVARHDKEYCFATVWRGRAGAEESLLYITTDRPIYRPKQKVQFKIVHRLEKKGALFTHAGLRLRAEIRDAKNETVHVEDLTLNEFGSAHGAVELGAEPRLGRYSIRIEPIDAMPGSFNRWSSRGSFRVDEYRKPEFKVAVNFEKPYVIQGDTLKGTVEARYFFGSPVSKAKVRFVVRKARHWSWWYRPSPWMRWYGDVRTPSAYGGETVKEIHVRLDAEGRYAFEIAVPRDDKDQDMRYTVSAAVTDLARRVENGAGTQIAHRAELTTHVSTDRWVYLPGQKVKATVSVRDHARKPVANQEVRIQALRRVWSPIVKRYSEVELETHVVRTGEDGKVTKELPLLEGGSIYLRARTLDSRGNETSAQRSVWVTREGWDGGTQNWRGLTIVADKESYKRGETATFLLTSEVKDLHLLFTLEGGGIEHRKVVKLDGHTATIQVPLMSAGLLPNFFATVSGLHANKVYQRQINVACDPSERFLTIEVKPDKQQYKPGAPARFEVITRDHLGQPVAAEVELGGVDEAIFALQEELAKDIRPTFVRRRYNHIQTRSSMQFYSWGRAASGDDGGAEGEVAESKAEAPAAGAARRGRAMGLAGKKQGGFVEAKVRTEFADTLFWRPTVTTNAEGRATVELPKLAENLTTWRLTARGIDRSGRVGQERTSILVRKEVIARLQTPRFYTQGDRAVVTAIVRNDLPEAKTMQVALSASGLVLEGSDTITVEVGPRQEKRFDWRVRVEVPGEARFVLKALTDTESDALERKVPVYPHGSLSWSSKSGLLDGEVRETFTLAADAMPEVSELTVTVTPTHAATVLDALEYLADYPYGCVEQTMSRFLPSTITRQVLQRMQIKNPWLEEHVPLMIKAGIDRLRSFQHGDGGWGWWKNDRSNPFTTAYVVYGLAMAQRADVAVPPRMMAGGIKAARNLLNFAETDEERVYLLYALSAAGTSVPDVRNALADGVAKMGASAQAMMALVLHRDGEAKEARRILDLLAAGANASGATAFWKGTGGYRWTGQTVETTALALEALLAIAPDHELVRRTATWLAMNRDSGHWVSTRQTAMAVLAMSKYLEKSGSAEPDMKLTLEVNGKQIWQRTVTPQNWVTFDGNTVLKAADLKPGENTVVLRREGEGEPVYALYLRQFEKKERFEASTGGLRVERRYRYFRNGRAVDLDPGEAVQSGDEVEVTLTVRADRRYDFLMLEDPMPSGFEAIRTADRMPRRGGWSYWWSNREFRDEKVDIAITRLDAGERTVSYRMRAEQPGLVRVLPARLWNMYRPGEGANSAGASFEVKPAEDER